jgi:glycosyltransferase involved in cell wall biosynthesis/protein-L-isoaspartate O-methyltransferase
VTESVGDLEFTGERYVPEVGGSIELEHVHRYLQAREIAAGRTVLDIASGEGYGSFILAHAAARVLGVDISAEAVEHARVRYRRENLEFRVGDCAAIPVPDASVDLVVSFETIEHHTRHEEMMREVKRVLKPGGAILISSPDKQHYSIDPGYNNEYHVKELFKEEFTALIGRYFKNSVYFAQRVVYGSAIFSESAPTNVISFARRDGNVTTTAGLAKPLYWIALASDGQLPGMASGTMEQPIEESEVTQFWRALVAERDQQIHVLGEKLGERNRQSEADANEIHRLIVQADALLKEKERLLAEKTNLRAQLDAIYASNTWKLTVPLRAARRALLSRPVAAARNLHRGGLRRAWHAAPLGPNWKNRIKGAVFTTLPFVFSSTKAYRDWRNFTAPAQIDPEDETAAADPIDVFAGLVSPTYVPLREHQPEFVPPVKLIAFYLPQFHAIPENDRWWGEGFTEWTNVRRARPIFEGHYQPRIPDELGYYNLLDPQVQKRQVELAKLYGVSGFCFYHYWFGGKRLLEQPVENYLANADLDLPFCLCWANENWSRRWDGLEKELLISQHHSADDDIDFIACVARFLVDSRNIRIGGRPLLLVYRPSLLPSARQTAQRWRQWCREKGVGEIYLAYTQSFDLIEPAQIGFDAAVEFPPNNSQPPDISEGATPLDGELTCTVYDWQVFLQRSRAYKEPTYKLFRSVCPSWDNTARRRRGGSVFLNSTPRKYGQWLGNAIDDTCRRFSDTDERLVFVNAWNEWAEGAYLEPDHGYGYAFLQAGRDALLERAAVHPERSIVLVVHDAHPHGAQFLALGMLRTLVEQFGYRVFTVVLGAGRLLGDFEKLSTACRLVDKDASLVALQHLAREILAAGYRRAIVNSAASGEFGRQLAQVGIDCVTLVHELGGVIRTHGLEDKARAAAQFSRCVVFPAQCVAEAFADFASVPADRQRIRPQGLWRRNTWRVRAAEARAIIRHRLGIAPSALMLLTVGYADLRKGVDLFVQIGLQILEQRPDAHFVWIGHWDVSLQKSIEDTVTRSGKGGAFHFVGFETNTAVYHAAADVYALTSREDPFPNVVLESFDAGVPVVAFASTGGGAELAARGGGRAVPLNDTAAFAEAVLQIAADPALAGELRRSATAEVDRNHAFRAYLFDLLEILGTVQPRVSVVVPNFNYARHVVARLRSILAQTVPIFELIILDDASTDDSVARICAWLDENQVEAQLVVNTVNSGCVARQWARGVALARGDFVWIAEADDLCSPSLLRTLLAPLEDDTVVLSYCESRQIDEDGSLLAPDYSDYLKDISSTRWREAYVRDGREEVAHALAIKNTIPNVSAVLFRRTALAEILAEQLEEIAGYRQAADWYVYLEVLGRGRVAFSPDNCNAHRRHSASVIGATGKKALLGEIRAVQSVAAQRHAPLPERTVEIARQYLEVLRKQFGLDEQAETVE